MPETTVDLDELEQRVTARFHEKIVDLWPLPDNAFDSVEFGPDWAEHLKPAPEQGKTIEISTVGQPLPPPLQFPPERWIVYSNRRIITLLICDRMLDMWDDLTPEQQGQVGFLLTYGGRERIS